MNCWNGTGLWPALRALRDVEVLAAATGRDARSSEPARQVQRIVPRTEAGVDIEQDR